MLPKSRSLNCQSKQNSLELSHAAHEATAQREAIDFCTFTCRKTLASQ